METQNPEAKGEKGTGNRSTGALQVLVFPFSFLQHRMFHFQWKTPAFPASSPSSYFSLTQQQVDTEMEALLGELACYKE